MKINDIQEKIINKSPLAFSFHKIIYDNRGYPLDFKLLEINPAFEKKFGLRRIHMRGRRVSEWLFSEEKTRKKWLNNFAEVVCSGQRKEFDEILEFNGHWFLIAAYVPYRNHFVILFQDISKLKQAETALEEKQKALDLSQALSQSFFDHSPSAIIIYQVLKDGATSWDYIIKSVNYSALQIEGWRGKDVIGKSLKELRPGVDKFGIIKAFQQVWKTGRSLHYPAKVYRDHNEVSWYENIIFKLPTGEIVAVYDNITETKEAEEKLFAEKEKFKVTLYFIGEGVITTDKEGRVELLNPAAEKMTGWKQVEAQGKPLEKIFDIYHEVTGEPCANPVHMVLESGGVVGLANHTLLKSKDGKHQIIADSGAPIKDHAGNILGVVLVFRDLTETKEQEERIEYLSNRDALTGLYNRAFFEQEIQRLDYEGQYPITLIIADSDGLKLINDVFGYLIGDQALIKLSEIIKASCRPNDIIFRWGGDEFVVLLPKTSKVGAEKICNQIIAASQNLKIVDTQLSISLGYATKNDSKTKWKQVLKVAEDNMYKAKLLDEKSHRSNILSSIKKALFEKSFETEEHGQRLGEFCREIGQAIGLSSFEVDELEVLAMLHDIGKIAIDVSILQKPDKLTRAEWGIMEQHPEIGYRIAHGIPELAKIANYILAHHERWDGRGYPRGLAGLEIPLPARILAVADAYDAMTQNRPYREALSVQHAQEELKNNSGTQFDPQIVDIFLTYLQNREKGSFKHIDHQD